LRHRALLPYAYVFSLCPPGRRFQGLWSGSAAL